MKRLLIVILVLSAAVIGGNIVSVQRLVWSTKNESYANAGIDVWGYHRYGLLPSEIVYDLWDVSGDKSMADVTRMFFQFAGKMKERKFERVHVAYRGKIKFVLRGEYFQELGYEWSAGQNPVYLVRTMSEHLYTPGGDPAFSSWSGGLIGVLSKQMEDFNEFHRQWYLNDMLVGG
jgi:hypothetical protein